MRRREIFRRRTNIDPVYKDRVLAKFVNCLMERGKKSVAERIIYSALTRIQDKTGNDPIEVFRRAVDNVKPQLEVKSRRVGGSTYQVPVEVRNERQEALAIRWLISYSRERPERGMSDSLAAELMDAANNRGNTIKKKEDTHRMAEANKAFSHYRW
jgi:small subunit ribosomal protein S7